VSGPWLYWRTAAAKDASYSSPAESATVYDNLIRKHKHHWKSRPARPSPVIGHVTEGSVASPSQGTAASSWTVSGTSQWQYPTDIVVSSASDVLHLQQFLGGKVGSLYLCACMWWLCECVSEWQSIVFYVTCHVEGFTVHATAVGIQQGTTNKLINTEKRSSLWTDKAKV